MKLTPRAKLLVIMGLFALPIAASLLAYNFLDIRPTANHGELLNPPTQVGAQRFLSREGTAFGLTDLAGRWVLATADAGACQAACRDKLVAMRQVRLALGRNASRVERVLLVDDGQAPDATALEPFPGLVVALVPKGMATGVGRPGDHGHIYLVDPNGNVVMRWAWPGETRGILKDLERLLKASQIG